MLEEANINTLQNLGAQFLHRFIATILNDNIYRDRLPMMIQLLSKALQDRLSS